MDTSEIFSILVGMPIDDVIVQDLFRQQHGREFMGAASLSYTEDTISHQNSWSYDSYHLFCLNLLLSSMSLKPGILL